MGETVIKVENVGMEYNLNKEKVDNLKEYVIKFTQANHQLKNALWRSERDLRW